jgi:hypothetical protein
VRSRKAVSMSAAIELADRNRIIDACSWHELTRALGTMSPSVSADPVSPTVAPYPPSTDYISDDLWFGLDYAMAATGAL